MELNTIHTFATAFPKTKRMPALFLGHGSPMNAIEENPFVAGFRQIATTLLKPNAILCISAHWLTSGTKVTAMEMPRTIHDFGGFPQELYNVQYPTKGNPDLAKETQRILNPTVVELDQTWGLDHGAWSVIKHLYPNADVPVIQMSIDYAKPASYHYELAKQLHVLRDHGILIIGSGNIIHNLRLVDFRNINKIGYGYDWAIEAHDTMNRHLLDGNHRALVEYEKLGTSAKLSIPTPDHYFPLMYALGLQQSDESITLFNDELLAGSLSMTSVRIG